MKRFVGMALCLVMMLGCGFDSQDEREAAPQVAVTLCGGSGGAGGTGGTSSTATASTTAASTTAASSSSTTAASSGSTAASSSSSASASSSTAASSSSSSSSSSSGSGGGGPVPGTPSIVPVPQCSWPTPTQRAPVTIQYGPTVAQSCDCYSPASPTGDADLQGVCSGFTGGSRTSANWIVWARHRADAGRLSCVCDVRHSAANGVNPFPAPLSDMRCAARTIAAMSPTGHLKLFGASAGGSLVDHTDATADRTVLTWGASTVTLDDGTCPIPWSPSDASIATAVGVWALPGDMRVKAKIQPPPPPPGVYQANLNAYFNSPLGESDPKWAAASQFASSIFWYRLGMAPRLYGVSVGDIVIYPEHTVGSGSALLVPGCTTSHPTGLTGGYPAAFAVTAASVLTLPCPSTIHLPTFAPSLIDCNMDSL